MTIELKMAEAEKKKHPCITLIGMPGAGKTTTGQALAEELSWAFLDTDKLIESLYGTRLQDITDHFGKNEFLKIEGRIIKTLDASRCVIATGGSVIYSKAAMDQLKNLGKIIYLSVPFKILLERIEKEPERGIAIAPGQTLMDLYKERSVLYEKYANLIVRTDGLNVKQIIDEILKQGEKTNRKS